MERAPGYITATIFLKRMSKALVYPKITQSYEKGSFYCINSDIDKKVYKFPISDISSIVETYIED